MNIVALLIPIALMMGLSGLLAFFWALKGGQFEDPDGAAIRILLDDKRPEAPAVSSIPDILIGIKEPSVYSAKVNSRYE